MVSDIFCNSRSIRYTWNLWWQNHHFWWYNWCQYLPYGVTVFSNKSWSPYSTSGRVDWLFYRVWNIIWGWLVFYRTRHFGKFFTIPQTHICSALIIILCTKNKQLNARKTQLFCKSLSHLHKRVPLGMPTCLPMFLVNNHEYIMLVRLNRKILETICAK